MIVRYYFDSERDLVLEFIIYAGTKSDLILMGFIPMNENQVKEFIEEIKFSIEGYPEDYIYELSFCHLIRGYMHSFGDKTLEKIKEEEVNYNFGFTHLLDSENIYPIFNFIY